MTIAKVELLQRMFNDNKQSILVGIAALLFFAFSLPALIVFVNGVSLGGAIEETIGARYFYTLRNLYGDELPWVPQGHFVGLFHYGIQLLLSASGHPPEELFPRVDIFVFVATILPHLISGMCFFWAVQPIRATSSRILVAALSLAIGYSSSLATGIGVNELWTQMIWWVTLPDYLAWALPHALVMMGAILRITTNNDSRVLTKGAAVWLGVFAGIAVATKITFLVFPFAIASVMLFHEPRWRTLGFLFGITFPVFVFTGFGITLAYFLGNFSSVQSSLENLVYWLTNERARSIAKYGDYLYTFSYWYKELWPRNWSDILYFPLVVMLAILVTGVVKKTGRFLLALVPACLATSYVAMHRFYHVTWVEFFFFFFAIIIIWGVTVFREEGMTITIGKISTKYLREASMPLVLPLVFIRVVLSVFLIWIMAPGALAKFQELYEFSKGSNAGSGKVNSLLSELGGRTVFLNAGGNNYRIRSIHSAICKGGIETFDPTWGQSKYMETMFPKMGCIIMHGPQNLTPYNNAVIIRLKEVQETREDAFRRVEDAFSLSLSPFDCTREVDFPDSIAIVCTRQISPKLVSSQHELSPSS